MSKAATLKRNGTPKVMSDSPELQRKVSTGSVAFAEKDQCRRVAKGLIPDNNRIDRAVEQVLDMPLYDIGLDRARVRFETPHRKEYRLDHGHRGKWLVTVPARGFACYVIE